MIGKTFDHNGERFVVALSNLDGSYICTSLRDLHPWRFTRDELLEILNVA